MRFLLLALAAVMAVAAGLAGSFSGTWASTNSGSSGKIDVQFVQSPSGETQAVTTFTFQGQNVATTPVMAKVEGDQLDLVFDYEIGGNKLRSKMKATVSAAGLKGQYISFLSPDGNPVDGGTWEAARK